MLQIHALDDASFADALYSYIVAKEPVPALGKWVPFSRLGLTVSLSPSCECRRETRGNAAVCIIGFCVDAFGETEPAGIPAALLAAGGESLESVYAYTARLAGKYVILYENPEGLYAIPDAGASIEIAYLDGETHLLASSQRYVADLTGQKPGAVGREILAGCYAPFDPPAFPYDATVYDKVRVVLPNHVLDVGHARAKRFGPKIPKAPRSLQEIIKETIRLTDHITKAYGEAFDLVCPLTGGWDSRLNLAFLKRSLEEPITCFTLIQKGAYAEPEDVDMSVPVYEAALGGEGGGHRLIPDLPMPEGYPERIARHLSHTALEDGAPDAGCRIIMEIGYPILQAFPGKAIVTGDLIDQIGKSCNFKVDFPCGLVTSVVLSIWLSNTSAPCRREMGRYLAAMRAFDRRENPMDLFALELRCGRWAAQSGKIYSLCGIHSLNIYNCRAVLEAWMEIPRMDRVGKALHKGLFSEIAPELMEIPFTGASQEEIEKGSRQWLRRLLICYLDFYFPGLKGKLKR